ncbi:MAG: NUDIX hydrolase, partial [Muribaculaceae bacterium]|nr:NUDIX hydrolase [Muribaculaceae bacterium]
LKYCYRYPHYAITADCVIFGFDGENLKILLVERGLDPYKGMWALPGGFMKPDEPIEATAERELREETNLSGIYLEQFKVFSEVKRDPRERVVTVAFIALVRPADYKVIAGDDASNAMWFILDRLPPLAFDHIDIIKEARHHLSETLRIKPVAFNLLNKYFSMTELQRVYEAINGTHYDRRNFQRKALQTGLIQEETFASLISDETICEDRKCYSIDRGFESSHDRGFESPHDRLPEKSSPRSRKKLFRFRPFRSGKERDSDSDHESSTRDIFNF